MQFVLYDNFLKWIYLSLLYHCGLFVCTMIVGWPQHQQQEEVRREKKNNNKANIKIFIENNWWRTQICIYIAIMSLLNLRYAAYCAAHRIISMPAAVKRIIFDWEKKCINLTTFWATLVFLFFKCEIFR